MSRCDFYELRRKGAPGYDDGWDYDSRELSLQELRGRIRAKNSELMLDGTDPGIWSEATLYDDETAA